MLLDLRSLLETAAANTYAGNIDCHSGVSAVCSGPRHVVAQDSRGDWVRLKRHGQAFVQPMAAKAGVHIHRVRADAAVVVKSLRAVAALGTVTASGQARQFQPRVRPAETKLARVYASADATASVRGIRAQALLRQVGAGADGSALVRGLHARARTRSASVVVGPDLVEQEFEEILLLLEAAA